MCRKGAFFEKYTSARKVAKEHKPRFFFIYFWFKICFFPCSVWVTEEDFERAIDRFAERKRDILCVQVLSREELNPQVRGKMHLFDAENIQNFFRKKIDKDRINAYKAALKYVTERIKTYCESRGGQYMLVPADAKLADVFFGNLVDLGVLK